MLHKTIIPAIKRSIPALMCATMLLLPVEYVSSDESQGLACLIRIPVQGRSESIDVTNFGTDASGAVTWVQTDEQLYHYKDNFLLPVLVRGPGKTGRIETVLSNETGHLKWLTTTYSVSLGRWKRPKGRLFQVFDNWLYHIPTQHGLGMGVIDRIAIDTTFRRPEFWAFTRDSFPTSVRKGAVYHYDAELRMLKIIPVRNGGDAGAITKLVTDPYGKPTYVATRHRDKVNGKLTTWDTLYEVYKPGSGSWARLSRYKIGQSFPDGDELTTIFDIAGTDSGHLTLVGTNRGLFRHKDERLHPVPVHGGGDEGEVTKIIPNATGGPTWVAADRRLFKYQNDELIRIPVHGGGDAGKVTLVVTDTINHTTWVGTDEALFQHRDDKLHRVVMNTGSSQWSAPKRILTDSSGNLAWVVVEKALYQNKNSELQLIPVKDGGETHFIEHIATDVSGNLIWIGAWRGLFQHKNGLLHPVSVKGGGDTYGIRQIVTDASGHPTWVAGWAGLYQYTNDLLERIPVKGGGETRNTLKVTTDASGRPTWIGGRDGLFRMSTTTADCQ